MSSGNGLSGHEMMEMTLQIETCQWAACECLFVSSKCRI